MGILDAINNLLKVILKVFGYIPVKTEEQKVEDSHKEVDAQIQKEEDGERPTWGK